MFFNFYPVAHVHCLLAPGKVQPGTRVITFHGNAPPGTRANRMDDNYLARKKIGLRGSSNDYVNLLL